MGVTIHFHAPVPVRKLLTTVLSGWHNSTSGCASPEIRVTCETRYVLESAFYMPTRGYSDLISLLNELLIAIAYAVKGQRSDLILLHGAAYENGAGSTVIFGEKKAGKSVLIAENAMRGARIYADDILLWSPKALNFAGLGMSPRLRRPVLKTIIESFGQQHLIAGQHTCYLSARALRLAPAGKSFSPDRVVELQQGGVTRQVRFYNVRQKIEQHRIS